MNEKKITTKDVKSKTKEFTNDRKNSNNLIDIITYSETEDEKVIMECIRSFNTIFSLLLSQNEMYFGKAPTNNEMQDLKPEEKYRLWLLERYDEVKARLLQLMKHENAHIQELSLCTMMKFVECESTNPLTKVAQKGNQLAFPVSLLEKIVFVLLNMDSDMEVLIKRFQEFLEYDDIRYFTMKFCLRKIKDAQGVKELNSTYITNMHNLLENISMPKTAENDKLTKFVCVMPESSGKLKVTLLEEHKKVFSTVWLEFLKLKLPTSIYKKVLLGIADKVIPHMTHALLLADFLTNSYNIGGAISLLALNGLFTLVHSFNLDYPDFFKKLYGLYEPAIFHVKYKARFFFLSDLFLTSTHIPAYLVAAFIKRLSRLLLTAPPSGASLALPFIYNLLRRHPECKVMVHRSDTIKDLATDPFSMEEPDPAKCNALESSLWEIKTMQEHYHHSVSNEAKKINQPLGEKETDISDRLELSIDDMFKTEMKKKLKTKVAVTFEAPNGLFGTKDDKFSDIWQIG